MGAWIQPDDLRGFLTNSKADDEPYLSLAAEIGCGEVDKACGPTMVTTITDERVETVKHRALLSCRVRALTSVVDATTSEDVTDQFVAVKQTLRRVDGGRVGGPLLVTFTSGEDAVPEWARSAALHVAQQYLATMRRFAVTGNPAPTGFLVPNVAMEEMQGHLLISGLGM